MSKYSTKFLQVSEPSPHVLHVELGRKPFNAFSLEFWREYGKLFDRLASEALDVRAVLLSSQLPKIFSAGIELGDASIWKDFNSEPARRTIAIRHLILEFQHAIGAPARCPFPVIAAVHGPVIGLGVDIICACDIRYASSDATFAVKEVDIGVAADIGTLAYLPKITGNHSLVRELVYTARSFSAAEADKLGLVSKVVEGGREGVVKAALDLAITIAGKSPIAVAGSKHLISHARDHTIAENLDYTAIWNGGALQTIDGESCLQARKTKETPKFMPLRNVTTKL